MAKLFTPMRTNVTFRYPAVFIPVSEAEEILSVSGVDWFVSLLRRIDGLSIERELCQEDWGVVVFVTRAGKHFWLGLTQWPDEEQAWLVHFHHHSFAWLQRFSMAGKHELERLIRDFHAMFANDSSVGGIAWYFEKDMRGVLPPGASEP